MGPFFSPGVPGSETASLAVRTRRRVVKVGNLVSVRLTRHSLLLLLFSSVFLWAPAGMAQPLALLVQFENPTFWIVYKWYIILFAAGFLTQAFLIAWLLITRTQRRRAEIESVRLAEARRQSEERSRAILEAVPDLMFLQTRDGVYVDYHARDRRDLLVPPEEFLGRNMRDVLPATLVAAFAQRFDEVQPGETQVIEYEMELNETRRWFEARWCGAPALM